MKLKNKIAVITGAGKGIGRAIAELYLKEGAKLVLVSRTKSDLDSFEKEYSDHKENFITIKCDISLEESVNSVVDKTISKFGRIDILVNNAGFGIFDNLVDSKTEDYDKMFNTNVRAVYLLSKGFLPYMIKQKEGTIINISSIAGKQGFATGSIYAATKHAVMGMSRALMLEVREHNVRIIAVCPGSVDTEFFRTDSQTKLGSKKESVLSSENIAEACLLAASLPVNATMSEIEIRPTNPRR